MSQPVAQVCGLHKRFGPVRALDGVDLELARGHVLALLGPNGAGKSTLLRILAGLVRPSAGEIRFALEGREPDRRDAKADAGRGRVGFVGHATLLYPELTARENLVFAGRLHDVANPEARARELLAQVALSDVADRRAGDFSRGMAQRLSIARALVHDPVLLLLDEPFTGLDPAAADRLVHRLHGLRDEGHSLLLVTHEATWAAAVADEACVLVRGRIAARMQRPGEGRRLDAGALARLWASTVSGGGVAA